MKKFLHALFIVIALFTSTLSFAQHCLDNTFNPNDYGLNYYGPSTTVFSSAIQSDGKILIGGGFGTYNGTTINRIARLNTDGSLDNSFNVGTGANSTINSIYIQLDGKILIGGSFTTFNGNALSRIARLNADGSVDNTFIPGTGANSTITSIALQTDGKILIGGLFTSYNGTSINRIARLNSDGTIDVTFTPGSGTNSNVETIVIQTDGKILIGGAFTLYNGTSINRIARINTDGTIDAGFIPGTAANNIIYTIKIQTDGQILIGGAFTTYNGTGRNRIARLNTNGTLDATLVPGTGLNNNVIWLSIQTDGKIVLAGAFTTYNGTGRSRIARINSDGSLDTGFDPGAGADNTLYTTAIQSDGKILFGGGFGLYNNITRNNFTRVNANGTLDIPFNQGTAVHNNNVYASAVQADGKIIIGGDFWLYDGYLANRITRLNADGSLDGSFTSGSGAENTVRAVAIQPDGKILIGGTFTSYNGTGRTRIARLNADGTLDATFNPGTGANNTVFSIAIQTDGKILIGGDFTSYNSVAGRVRIIRLNSDGTFDATFTGTGANSTVNAIALQTNGKILIGGSFTTYNGSPAINRIARINDSDGTLDGTFTGTGTNGTVNSISLQTDGKVLIGGAFTLYNGVTRNRLARINTDGTLDTGFDPLTSANNTVLSVAFQPSGTIFIGGTFTTFNGSSRNRIARVTSTGTLDNCFNPGSGFNNTVNTISLSGSKTIIGGLFTSYDGLGKNRIVQLMNCTETNLTKSCLNYGSVIVSVPKSDSLYIKNPTCNTLTVFNITKSLPEYTLNTASSFTVAAYDSAKVKATFLPSSPASFIDTLRIFNSLADTFVCLSGIGIPPPVITVSPASYSVTLSCNDSISLPLVIGNTGGSDLTYQVEGGGNATLKVALVAAEGNVSYRTDVQSKLMATGKFSQVDIFTANTMTPSLAQLMPYDAVLVWSNTGFSNATTMGNNLADYVDAGGGVVTSVFTTASVPLAGRFNTDNYWCINPSGQTTGQQTLGTVFFPNHVIMKNVNSFNGGTSSWRQTSTLVNPLATRIADWTSGQALVATRKINNSYRADLGMFPPSNDALGGCWLPSTNGAMLMANALHYSFNGGGVEWMALAPSTNTVTALGSSTVTVTFNSTGLSAGTYTATITVSSNDPATPVVTIPVTLTVAGSPDINIPLPDACPKFDTILTFTTDTAIITIENLGCDTLFISNISSSSGQFIVGTFPAKISPFDSALVNIIFAPTSPGNKTTTITVDNISIADTSFCLMGFALPPPTITVAPPSFTVTLSCNDSVTNTLTVGNTGGTDLIFDLGSDSTLASACNVITTGYCCNMGIYNVTFNTINNNSANGSAGYQNFTSINTSVSAGSSYNLSVQTGTTYNENVRVWIDYNDNGIFEAGELVLSDLNTLPNVFHTATVTIPLSAVQRSALRMRVGSEYEFNSPPSSCNNVQYGQYEDYTIFINNWLTIGPPSADTIAPSGTINIPIEFNSSGLLIGQHTYSLSVNSNDPLNPQVLVPCTLNVVGTGDFQFAGFADTTAPLCLDMDSIMEYTTSTDTFFITNIGCDTLWIDSALFSPSVFSLDTFTPFILPGDTGSVTVLFSPVSAGSFTGTASVYTNDLDTVFCVKGKSFLRPIISVNPTSFNVTLGCNDTIVDTLTVSNIGGSNLNYNTTVQFNLSTTVFADGFESGNISSWTTGAGAYTRTVTTTSPATGTFCLGQSGGFGTYGDGLRHTFPSAPAEYISFKYKSPSGSTGWNCAVNIGRASDIISNGAIADQWIDNASMEIYMYCNSGTYTVPMVQNQWYAIEYRNINYTTKTFDYYVNNTLIGSNLSFWNTLITSIDVIHLFGWDANHTSFYDDIFIGQTDTTWMSIVPPGSGTVTPSGSDDVLVVFDSRNLLIGTYTGNIFVSSNDPLNPQVTVPCTLNVVGAGDFEFAGFTDTVAPLCLDLDSIMEFTTSRDTVIIANLGCDTLWIDSVLLSPSVFSLDTASPFILPGDTGGFIALFSPVSVGSFTGTASVYTNDLDTVFCLKGKSFLRPIISISPDTVSASLACCDSITIPVTVSNTGGSDLIFSVLANQNFTDGFESGLSKWVTGGAQGANWAAVPDPYTGAFSLGEFNGSYGNGWYQYIQLAQKLKVTDAANCVLSLWDKWQMECCCDNYRTQISVNGGPFITLSSVNCNQAAWTQKTYPLSAYLVNGDSLQVRFEFSTDGSVVGTGINIDDISVSGINALPDWISISPVADTVAPAGNSIVNFELNSCGLLVGTYTASVVISSNDPLSPMDTVTTILNVAGAPDFVLEALFDTIAPLCLDLDSIMTYTTSLDSIGISNMGCDTLFLDSLVFSPAVFSASAYDPFILPGDTGGIVVQFAPLASGSFTGTLNLYTNDLDTVFCLKGKAFPRPIQCHNPDSFFITIPVCEDTVTDQLLICNSGGSDLIWNIFTQANLCDDFDPGINGPMWSVNTGVANTNCGPFSGNGLWFGNAGSREAATVDMNTLVGGNISFYLKLPQTGGGAPCEDADQPSESVVLEYSNAGAAGPWTTIATYNYNSYPNLTLINQVIPAGAKTVSTRFRWRQLGNSGTCCDHWLLDNLCITTLSANVFPVPSTDTTTAGDTTYVTVFFTNSGLTAGTYNIPLFLNSNDPLNQSDTITVMLTIDTVGPVKPVVNDTSVCFGNPTPPLIATGTTPGDTIKWYDNPGLTNLVFTGNPFVSTQTAVGTYVYYVTATDTSYGCESAADIAILTINAPPPAPTAGANSPACTGQNLSLTASSIGGATYSWTGPNSFTSSAQNPIIFSLTTAAAGTYSVTATVGGCPTGPAGTVTVAVNQTPASPSASSNSPICAGNNLSLTASTVGGSTYSWTGPNSFTSTLQNPAITPATSAATGNYSVTATENGCTSPAGTTSVTVTGIPAAPTAGFISPACTGTTLSLTASTISGATYSWSGPNSFTATVQNPTIASVTTAASGTYSVFASVNGCSGATATVSITVNVTPSAPSASATPNPVCSGTTLSLSATAAGSPGYNWSGPNSFVSPLQNPTIASITTAGTGTYSVTATLAGCVSPAGTVSVTVNQTPAAPVAGSNSPVCAGQNISLTASSTGTTYSWTGPNSFTSTVQNPSISGVGLADAGTYSVTATTNGCTGLAGTINVIVNPPPAAPVAGSNSPVCSGQTLSLTATSTGATYSWTGPNSFTSTNQNPTIGSVTTLANGTYSVVAINAGCAPSAAGTTTVTIYQTPSAPVTSSNSPVCVGDNISLTSTTGGSPTYSWTGPNSFTDATQNPVIASAGTVNSGTYSVTASENGCTGPAGTTSVIVNNPPTVPVAGSNSPVCSGQTLSLTASNSGTTYNWTGPNTYTSTTQNPNIASVTTAASGTYSVTASVPGCPTSAAGTTAVTINQTPSAPTAGSNSPICAGTDLSLTATTGGSPTYSWTGPNSFTDATQNPVISPATTAATGTYSVTATETGCTGPAGTVSVTVNPPPGAPLAGSNTPVCSGLNLSLTASTIPGATYSWTGPNGYTSTSQNPVLIGVATSDAGTYSVTATVPGCPTGPAGTTAVTINQTPSAPSAGSNSPICAGSDLSLTASTVGGSAYTWTGPNSFTSTTQNPVISPATTAASGTYSVTATEFGCLSPGGTVTVTVNPIPAAPIVGNNSPICVGSDLSLTATAGGGAIYSWSGPNGFTSTTQNPVIIGAGTVDAGTYSVTSTENGCTGPAGTTTAVVNTSPSTPVAGSNSPVCSGQTLSLTSSSAGASYSWSGPNGFTSTSQNPNIGSVTTAATGTYSVIAINAGCPASAVGTISVIINQTPSAPVAGSNAPICEGSDLSLTASTGGSPTYSWIGPNSFTSATQNPVISPATTAATGTYSVTATEFGCVGPAATVSVTVNPIPAAPTAGSNSPVCEGQALSLTATAGGSPTYNWSGPNGFTSTSQNPVITPALSSHAGTYSVTVTENGCTGAAGTTSVTILPLPASPVSSPQSDSICFGDPNPTFTATGTTVEWWSDAATTVLEFSGTAFTPTVTATGTYTYYVTQTSGGCKSLPDTVIFSINLTPALAVNDTSVIFGAPPVVLNASGTNVQWYDISMNPLGAGNSYNTGQTAVGTYTYIVTQTISGCESANDTVVLTILPGAPLGVSDSVCFGQPVPDLTATGTNIQWYSDGALTILAGTGSPFATGQTAVGTYTYYVTQTINFIQSPSDTVTLTINAIPSAPTSADQSACFGGTVPDMTSTGTNVQWYDALMNPIGTGSPFATGETAVGTYTYYVTQTVSGCESPSDTSTLTINSLPAMLSGNDTAICFGDATPDLIVSGTNISWYDTGMVIVSVNDTFATGLTAGGTYTYYVTQTNLATGCESPADTVILSINITPVPSSGDVLSCFGSPVPPFTATGTNIQWYDTSGAVVATGNSFNTGITAVGTYTYYVTATDATLGCESAQDTVLLIIGTPPTVPPSAADTSSCFGQATPDLITTSGTISNWYTNPALGNPIFVGDTFATGQTLAGTYIYYVTDSFPGCAEGPADTVVLTIYSLPAAPVVNDTTVCFGNPTPDLIAAGSNITWYDTSMAIVSVNDTFATGITAAGSYTYYVTQTNGVNGCMSPNDTVTLTINALPAMPIASDTTVCSGMPVPNLSASGSNVQWYNSSMTFLFAGSSYATGQTAAGVYTYYVTDLNGTTGCESAADTSVLTILLTPPLPVSNNVAVCVGNPVPPFSATGTNVSWYSDAGLTNLVNTGNSYNSGQTAVGSYTYYLTDSLPGCVSGVDTVNLVINNVPVKPLSNDTTMCYGNTGMLSATGNNPVWYSDPTLIVQVGTGNNFNTGVTAVGIYTYYVTDFAAGCGNSPSDTTVLTINPSPLVTANTYSVAIQQGNSVTLMVYNALTYVWTPAAGLNTTTGSTVIASPSVTTTYTVTGTNSYGCSNDTSILVIVNPVGVPSVNEPLENLNIYPNPAIDHFTLEFNSTLETPIEIYLLNTLGEKVRVMQSDGIQGQGLMKHKYEINTGNLTEGVYHLEIITEKGTVNRRVILFR